MSWVAWLTWLVLPILVLGLFAVARLRGHGCGDPAEAAASRRGLREVVHEARNASTQAVAASRVGVRRSEHLFLVTEDAIRQLEKARKSDDSPDHS